MTDREKHLQKLMNKNLKISTLITYKFKNCEIITAIKNMTTNLAKQQSYFLQFQDYKKQRNIYVKNYRKRKRKKMFSNNLLEVTKLNFLINKNQIKKQNLLAKCNKIDFFIKKQKLLISSLKNQHVLQEEPLDLSLSKQKQLLQLESQNNKQQSNDNIIYQQYLNNMIEKRIKEFFSGPENIWNEKSSSYASNFNDIQAHLLSQELQENNYLNATNQETYLEPVSDIQKKVAILRFG